MIRNENETIFRKRLLLMVKNEEKIVNWKNLIEIGKVFFIIVFIIFYFVSCILLNTNEEFRRNLGEFNEYK